ncbi:MAG: metalloregulator ArsR/SmtB family transcription factor [Planctomycetales bacterium]|nr:metalloregulator ArsR/SmtB family transcription factor [Planctomycetales bacterium]
MESRRPAASLSVGPDHAEAFGALAHPARLAVLARLVRARREMTAGELRRAVRVPAPTLSHHLAALRRAALVRVRRVGRHRFHAVDAATISDLVRLLTACC